MLSIFDAGDESFRLVDRHDQDVGWIRGSALGFDGFAAEADAVAAAVAGSAALFAYLERLTGASLAAPPASGRVRLTHDGAYEWVTRGKALLARLYRPELDHPVRRRRRTFGVEFVLPSYVKSGAAISASQVVHNAIASLQRSGAEPAPANGASVASTAAVAGVAVH